MHDTDAQSDAKAAPRPTLVQFALGTLVIGFASLLAGVSVMGIAPVDCAIAIAIVVAQGLGTFARSRRMTIAVASLLLVPILFFLPQVLGMVFRGRVLEEWQSFLKVLMALILSTTAVASNIRWAARIKEANANGSVILRYSLKELAVIFTMLCVVAAVFAAIFQRSSAGWG